MKYHFDISNKDFSLAGSASTEIKKILKSLHLPDEIIKRTVIAMYEAETNIIVHAGDGKADVEISDTEIVITMTDHGPGILDINAAMQEGFSTASGDFLEMGYGAGVGLSNMKQNTDSLIIDSIPGKGTSITMSIKLV